MKSRVIVRPFDPVDVADRDEDDPARLANCQSLGVARRRWRIILGAKDLIQSIYVANRFTAHVILAPPERLVEPRVVDRLQHVIHGGHVERANGVFVVCGDKDDGGHICSADGPNDAKTIQHRHLHIEQDQIRTLFQDGVHRAFPILGGRQELELGIMTEKSNEPLPGDGFIVDDQHAETE